MVQKPLFLDCFSFLYLDYKIIRYFLIFELDQIFEVHKDLFIGAYWPRLNFEMFKDIGITAIVNLMEENLYNPTPLGFHYLHKGFADDTYPPHEYLDEILNFIDLHLNNNGKVLIHCSMGVSRSGGIIVAWLLRKNPDWSWEDGLSYVKKTKFIAPAVEIKQSVLDYIRKIYKKE